MDAGAANIDLRGPGAQRNLVLMNGKRMVPFNFNGTVHFKYPHCTNRTHRRSDGWCLAVYGSDAVAGAVNVILKNNLNMSHRLQPLGNPRERRRSGQPGADYRLNSTIKAMRYYLSVGWNATRSWDSARLGS